MRINGHYLHVEEYGSPQGPAVVLLHHGLGSAQAWSSTWPALAAAGWRVVVYDRWGYGRSDRRLSLNLPYFETDLADLNVLLDRLGLEQAALVGHSDGGTLALYYAAAHPDRVPALVVIAAHIYLEASMEQGILGVAQAYQENERFQQGLRRAHGEKTEQVFRNWYDGWTGIDANPALVTWDMRPTLAAITCPTLVVQGLEDEHATLRHAQDLAAALPQAELWLMPGAGHMLPQDRPAEFNRKLLEFLNGKERP